MNFIRKIYMGRVSYIKIGGNLKASLVIGISVCFYSGLWSSESHLKSVTQGSVQQDHNDNSSIDQNKSFMNQMSKAVSNMVLEESLEERNNLKECISLLLSSEIFFGKSFTQDTVDDKELIQLRLLLNDWSEEKSELERYASAVEFYESLSCSASFISDAARGVRDWAKRNQGFLISEGIGFFQRYIDRHRSNSSNTGATNSSRGRDRRDDDRDDGELQRILENFTHRNNNLGIVAHQTAGSTFAMSVWGPQDRDNSDLVRQLLALHTNIVNEQEGGQRQANINNTLHFFCDLAFDYVRTLVRDLRSDDNHSPNSPPIVIAGQPPYSAERLAIDRAREQLFQIQLDEQFARNLLQEDQIRDLQTEINQLRTQLLVLRQQNQAVAPRPSRARQTRCRRYAFRNSCRRKRRY